MCSVVVCKKNVGKALCVRSLKITDDAPAALDRAGNSSSSHREAPPTIVLLMEEMANRRRPLTCWDGAGQHVRKKRGIVLGNYTLNNNLTSDTTLST